MRLPDDFDDEDNNSMGLPMIHMVIGVAAFILVLFAIIIAVNYKNTGHHNKNTDTAITVETSENQETKDLKERTEELISGSTLRSDDLDFWDMYPEQETKETQVKETEETKEEPKDPSTDGKHTLVTYASGRQEWVSINPYIKKNSYDYTNLVSQNNMMKYYEGSRLTSFLGVDISKNDGTVDFDMLKAAGVSFVMIRTGSRGYESGQLMEDELFTEHMDGALAAGLDVGLYFSSAAISKEEAEEEANMLLAQIGERKITYPIAFQMAFADNDVSRFDKLTAAQRTEITRAFLNVISNAGYRPMVYGDKEWLIKEIDLSKLGDYDFWLSQPGDLPDYPYAFSIWQYSTTKNIDGINGTAHVNISFIDYASK